MPDELKGLDDFIEGKFGPFTGNNPYSPQVDCECGEEDCECEDEDYEPDWDSIREGREEVAREQERTGEEW